MLIIGAVLSLLVPFLIYRYILKGTERTITNGKYITTFLLSATVYMIPIIIIQLAFDRIFKINPAESSSILEGILVSFFRAALLEEGTKFFFVNQTLKRNQDLSMKETVLLAGVIGIGFGFLEKLVQGGGALISNAFFPGHLIFQWVMGYFMYKAMRAEGNERKKLYAKAYLVPFVIHGLWDSGLEVGDILTEGKGVISTVFGVIILVAMVVLYIIAFIRSIKAVRKIED